MSHPCPDCGAPLIDGEPCETYFHQMLYWENMDPANGRVHHLMVLCYYLQHPAKYSRVGLVHGRKLLARFVEAGESPANVRQQMNRQVASDNRDWKVTGSTLSRGAYDAPISWQMTAADVVQAGIENYCDNVERWAGLINEQLKTVAPSD